MCLKFKNLSPTGELVLVMNSLHLDEPGIAMTRILLLDFWERDFMATPQ